MISRSRLSAILFVLLCLFPSLWGQKPNVVVTIDSTSVNIVSNDYYTTFRHREMLLVNNKADALTDIQLRMDPNDQLLGFECEMYDMAGNRMSVLKKRDLQRVDYSRDLATDYYRLVAELIPPRYPVLVKVTTRMARRGNVISYPRFYPQVMRGMAVEHAVYQISWPTDKVLLRQKAFQIPEQSPHQEGNRSVLTYVLDTVPALPVCPLAANFGQSVPNVMFAPLHFCYYDNDGSMADWNQLGQWCYQLTRQTDFLSDDARRQADAALASCQSDMEKVKALYDLMHRHTRYVSLQLGIGGYKPKAAGEVHSLGYGDCKGLSNYMRGMLRYAGIDSRLALVSVDEPRLIPDFANFQQCDHMVLEVFLPRAEGVDTLWIECTDPRLPMGYAHMGISGHDVIELTDKGGRLLTIPEYADTLNLEHTDIHFTLRPDASADLSIDSRCEYHRCQQYLSLLAAKEQDQRTELLSLYAIPGAKGGTISISDDSRLGDVPCIRTHIEATCTQYANQTGRRYFVPVNPLREPLILGIDPGDASQPMYVDHGCRDEMSIHLTLPQCVSVEALPSDVDLEEDFASFHQHIELDGSEILVTLRMDLRSGTYPAGSRQRLAQMQRTLSKAYAAKIVLLRK